MAETAAKKSAKWALPYQAAWINEPARYAIAEKSARTGFTQSTALWAVRKKLAVKKGAHPSKRKVWYSANDDDTAKEFIDYCAGWAKLYGAAFKLIDEFIIDEKEKITAHQLRFENGCEINALSSNPRALHGKGGDVILDEFALHKQARQVYEGANRATMWGGDLRILSTHWDEATAFNSMLKDIKTGGELSKEWRLHRVTIFDAICQGLVERINSVSGQSWTRDQFIADLRSRCLDENEFQRMYNCTPLSESSFLLPYELISTCEDPLATEEYDLEKLVGPCYLGVDIGRRRDLTVFWLDELVGDVAWTRIVKVMDKAPFRTQYDFLRSLLKRPEIHRAAIDATGLGMQIAEDAVREFGESRVDAVTFTGATKEALAVPMKQSFEDRTERMPISTAIREDLHMIRKIVTGTNSIRFDAQQSDAGHADRFWAKALARSARQVGDVVVDFLGSGERLASSQVSL